MAFVNVNRLKRTVKVLVIGPTGAGKTYPGLQLEGRIGAFDGEDGLKAYRDAFDFDIDPFDDIEELNGKLSALVTDAATLQTYNTILVDGMTVAWHAALREAENDNGQIEFSKQRDLKGGFKEFNDYVFKLGKKSKNVWVTAQSKADWEIKPGQKPVLKGHRGDVDQRIWYAFDLVLYVDFVNQQRIASVLKSRFPGALPLGTTLKDFNPAVHLKPIFEGTAKYVEETAEAGRLAEMARVREQIKGMLTKLSARNGGPMEEVEARRIWADAGAAQDPDVLAEVLAKVREFQNAAPVAG